MEMVPPPSVEEKPPPDTPPIGSFPPAPILPIRSSERFDRTSFRNDPFDFLRISGFSRTERDGLKPSVRLD